MNTQYKFNKILLAISVGLAASSAVAQEEQAIDEVVSTATRLQGSAAAVIEERKNQAFVADILGAEQLSRTGDSDAAAALRRVTGLTLVDGKFIYVRGLGERYSSARLNGAAIPSPDLTRNVIPLDIFPSSIIESLAVQKAYSPSMPAAFGGGNIDIRTKGVPSEFVASLEVGVGADSESRDGFTYNRNTDGISDKLNSAIVRYRGDFSLRGIISRDRIVDNDQGSRADQATRINADLVKALPRDLSLSEESLDPSYSFKGTLGHSIEEKWFGGQLGVLTALSYDTDWEYSDRRTGVIAVVNDDNGDVTLPENCSASTATSEDVSNSCFVSVKDSKVTTETERLNGVLNLGYRLDNHEVTYSKMYLEDNEDESDISILQSPNGSTVRTIAGTGQAQRAHEFNYEERTLDIDQFKGTHTFFDWWGMGIDWQYTESSAETDIPMDVSYRFIDSYDDSGNYLSSGITGDDNRAIFSFIDLKDNVKSYSGNLSLPLSYSGLEIELKAGYDFVEKARYYTTSSFSIDNETGTFIPINTGSENINNLTAYLNDDFVNTNDFFITFNEPRAPSADDYLAGQKVDAAYGEFDLIFDNAWRVSGGLRYEDFKQTSIGFSSLIFTREDFENFYSAERIEDGSIVEDDFYPALSVTYLAGTDYQIRFGYGETVVRPDVREIVPVAYFDPLTDIRTFGFTNLTSSTLKNYDFRFEYYAANGNNYSVGAFYKDINAPIETILSVGDEDYSATFRNGEQGEVYGVEAEWLHDLTWIADGLFTSGNITLSDSEVSIDPAIAGNLTNREKRLTGHSQYVVNIQLSYDSNNGEHSASLVYNVFGERILASGIGGRDEAFEQPFNSLDFVYTWYPDFNSNVKLKVQNILGEDQEVTQNDVVVRSRSKGTGLSLNYSYEF